jgi:hypothetical protein
MKYDVNKINIILFIQQVEWFGSKRVELHSWGPFLGSKDQSSHMWHSIVLNWNIDIIFYRLT